MTMKRDVGRAMLRDVAARAGVSQMTVSRVLNGSRGVGEGTRFRVMDAIAVLGFEADEQSLALAGPSRARLTLLYQIPGDGILPPFLNSCLDEARRLDVHVGLRRIDGEFDEERLSKELQRTAGSGVILTPPLSDDARLRAMLDRLNLFAVAIGTLQYSISIPSLSISNRRASYDLARHLFDLGHRKIAFITGCGHKKPNHERLEGFRCAVRELGISDEPGLVFSGRLRDDSIRVGIDSLFSSLVIPTAIMAVDDEIARAAIGVLKSRGMRVPEDISVCGFDDMSRSSEKIPELTTVRQPVKDMARLAIDILIKNADKPEGRRFVRSAACLELRHELVYRQSTAPPSKSPEKDQLRG